MDQQKFDTVNKNILHERQQFYNRNQIENETFDQFYNELQNLIRTCNFGTSEIFALRDRIVFGIRKKSTRQKLIDLSDPSLEKTVEICRLAEKPFTGKIFFF